MAAELSDEGKQSLAGWGAEQSADDDAFEEQEFAKAEHAFKHGGLKFEDVPSKPNDYGVTAFALFPGY